MVPSESNIVDGGKERSINICSRILVRSLVLLNLFALSFHLLFLMMMMLFCFALVVFCFVLVEMGSHVAQAGLRYTT